MCELLNKTSRQGGNLGSAGQTVGELQGNREIFFESLDLTIFPLQTGVQQPLQKAKCLNRSNVLDISVGRKSKLKGFG